MPNWPKFLFVRNTEPWAYGAYVKIENYIRDARMPDLDSGTYSETCWETPIHYRFPFLTNTPQYKLIRSLKATSNTLPKLILLNKVTDPRSWNQSQFPYLELPLDSILSTLDENSYHSLFIIAYHENHGPFKGCLLKYIKFVTKNYEGIFIDIFSRKKYYEENGETFCVILASFFKLNKLPLYTMFLNNNFVINKVWHRNIGENPNLRIYSEDNSLSHSIFNPIVSGDAITLKNSTLVSQGNFTIDLYGTKKWKGQYGRQEEGSEIILEGIASPPPLGDLLHIKTNLAYRYDGSRKIDFNPQGKNGYIQLAIDAGPFFSDFYEMFRYDFVVISS